jgi:AhpD family alkylhydroperoxidase
MARIEGLAEETAPPEIRAVYTRVKTKYGASLEPVTIAAHHPEIFKAYMGFETAFAGASRVDLKLKELAMLKIAGIVGCPFCIDFGSAKVKQLGISDEQVRALPCHRETPVFSRAERLVLDLAEQMTQTPANVSDALFAELRTSFDSIQIIEITSAIAWENYRSRFNHALGIQAHGFSNGKYCLIPES